MLKLFKKITCLNLAILLIVLSGMACVFAKQVNSNNEDIVTQAIEPPDHQVKINENESSVEVEPCEAGSYTIFIDDTSFNSEVNASGSGWTYSAPNHILTLNNYIGKSISASGDLTIYAQGTNSVSSTSLHAIAGDTVSLNVISGTTRLYGAGRGDGISCSEANINCLGNLEIYGGYHAEDAGYGIYCNYLFLFGKSIKISGGNCSNTKGKAGFGIFGEEVNIFADAKIKGGDGYISGPAIVYGTNVVFGLNTISIDAGQGYSQQYQAICYLTNHGANENWFEGLKAHTTLHYNSNLTSLSITIDKYTLSLLGNGGQTYSGETSRNIIGEYPSTYDLSEWIFNRTGYTQVGWTEVSSGSLRPLGAYITPGMDLTLSAIWQANVPGSIMLSSLRGEFSDGTLFRVINEVSTPLPSNVHFSSGSNLLVWSDQISASDTNLHVKPYNCYEAGDVIEYDSDSTIVLYAKSDDGAYARYHATKGSLKGKGTVLLQGVSSDTLAATSATSLKTYVIDDKNLVAPENCEFLGWATSANSNSVSYSPGDPITLKENKVLDLYAVWKEVANVIEWDNGVTTTTQNGKTNISVTIPSSYCSANGIKTAYFAEYVGDKMKKVFIGTYNAGRDLKIEADCEGCMTGICKLIMVNDNSNPVCNDMKFNVSQLFQ